MPSSGNKDALLKRLLDTPTIELFALQQELIDTWFMPPLKKTTSMVIGTMTEDKIANKLAHFLDTNTAPNLDGYSLETISECGICYNENHKALYTSADRLCMLVNQQSGDSFFLPS